MLLAPGCNQGALMAPTRLKNAVYLGVTVECFALVDGAGRITIPDAAAVLGNFVGHLLPWLGCRRALQLRVARLLYTIGGSPDQKRCDCAGGRANGTRHHKSFSL
jgi:hypothetical protein